MADRMRGVVGAFVTHGDSGAWLAMYPEYGDAVGQRTFRRR